MIRATERILELCVKEASLMMKGDSPTALQGEQLMSPVLKYLLAFANKPAMCTETQISKNLSIPRPVTREIIQTLESYEIIQPFADFSTVKPYAVTRIAPAVTAGWVTFTPEEVQLLFGVRDSKRFSTKGRFDVFLAGVDATRWLPPMEAAISFFSAMIRDMDLVPEMNLGSRERDGAYLVDAIFLGRLLQSTTFWDTFTRDVLLFLDEKKDVTKEDCRKTARRVAEKYCWIYFRMAEKILSVKPEPRREYLSFMSEVLGSCLHLARMFGAEDMAKEGEELLQRIEAGLSGSGAK